MSVGAVVHTDGWSGYLGLARLGYDHRPLSQRAHLLAGGDPSHLDEFVFRFNRRRTPMAAFQTLLGLGSQQKPTTYREISTARLAWRSLA